MDGVVQIHAKAAGAEVSGKHEKREKMSRDVMIHVKPVVLRENPTKSGSRRVRAVPGTACFLAVISERRGTGSVVSFPKWY